MTGSVDTELMRPWPSWADRWYGRVLRTLLGLISLFIAAWAGLVFLALVWTGWNWDMFDPIALAAGAWLAIAGIWATARPSKLSLGLLAAPIAGYAAVTGLFFVGNLLGW